EIELLLETLGVADDAAGVALDDGDEPREPHLIERALDDELLHLGHGVAVVLLIAGQHERVERQRVLLRRRPALLDERAEDPPRGLVDFHGRECGRDGRAPATIAGGAVQSRAGRRSSPSRAPDAGVRGPPSSQRRVPPDTRAQEELMLGTSGLRRRRTTAVAIAAPALFASLALSDPRQCVDEQD